MPVGKVVASKHPIGPGGVPGQNVPAWTVVVCSKCKKKLKNAIKPFIRGPENGAKIYCDRCQGMYFCHYFPPNYFKHEGLKRIMKWKIKAGLPPYNPSSRRDGLNGN